MSDVTEETDIDTDENMCSGVRMGELKLDSSLSLCVYYSIGGNNILRKEIYF